MLWLILGDYGAGKTIFLILNGVSAERKVLGNLTFNWNNYERIDPLDLEHVSNAVVILDEMQNWIESRISGSYQNLFITNVANQSQKRDMDIYGTIHTYTSVDYRFRRNAHRLVLAERIGREPKGNKRGEDTRDFRYTIMNTFTGELERKTLRYEDAVKYFELYDTWELIDPQNWEKMKLELLKATKDGRKKLYKVLEGLSEMISKTLPKKITHASVRKEMLKYGLDLSWEDMIYSFIVG